MDFGNIGKKRWSLVILGLITLVFTGFMYFYGNFFSEVPIGTNILGAVGTELEGFSLKITSFVDTRAAGDTYYDQADTYTGSTVTYDKNDFYFDPVSLYNNPNSFSYDPTKFAYDPSAFWNDKPNSWNDVTTYYDPFYDATYNRFNDPYYTTAIDPFYNANAGTWYDPIRPPGDTYWDNLTTGTAYDPYADSNNVWYDPYYDKTGYHLTLTHDAGDFQYNTSTGTYTYAGGSGVVGGVTFGSAFINYNNYYNNYDYYSSYGGAYDPNNYYSYSYDSGYNYSYGSGYTYSSSLLDESFSNFAYSESEKSRPLLASLFSDFGGGGDSSGTSRRLIAAAGDPWESANYDPYSIYSGRYYNPNDTFYQYNDDFYSYLADSYNYDLYPYDNTAYSYVYDDYNYSDTSHYFYDYNNTYHDIVTMSFKADFTDAYNDNVNIDALLIKVHFPSGYIPQNMKVVNNSNGSVFDQVALYNVRGRKMAVFSLYDLNLSDDAFPFDFVFQDPAFTAKTVTVSAEVLTSTRRVYAPSSINYSISDGIVSLPVDSGGIATVPSSFDLVVKGTGTAGAFVDIPRGTQITGASGWNGTLAVVSSTNDSTTLSVVDAKVAVRPLSINKLVESTDPLVSVVVDMSVDSSLSLADEAIVVLPYTNFARLTRPSVTVVGGDGLSRIIGACSVSEYIGSKKIVAQLEDSDKYSLAANDSCYVIGTGAAEGSIFVATRHFSTFVAGSVPADTIAVAPKNKVASVSDLQIATASDVKLRIPASSTVTSSLGSWDGALTISKTSTIPPAVVDSYDAGTVVNISSLTGNNITLNKASIAVIPYTGFSSLTKPLVKIVDSSGVTTKLSRCTVGAQYTGSISNSGALVNSANYSLASTSSACYMSYDNVVYVATRHFSNIVVGGGVEEEDDDEEEPAPSPSPTPSTPSSPGGGGGGGGGSTRSTPSSTSDKGPVSELGLPSVAVTCDANLSSPFVDIKAHYAENAINYLYWRGVVVGYEDNLFKPDQNVNRVEFLKMTMETLEYYVPEMVKEGIFPDVDYEDWYGPYVFMGNLLKIVIGYEDGTFGPGNNITRAEAVKIVLFADDRKISDGTGNIFYDVLKEDWFSAVVETAYSLNIIRGYSSRIGYFGPNDPITRGQAAIVLKNIVCK